tara:strand:+ start:63 stop:719 length:657 start_codon:yes stop_codon:yes gene_type:complete
MKQLTFPFHDKKLSEKTYRAIRHDIVRNKQALNSPEVHHPEDKVKQIIKVLPKEELNTLELFAGQQNLTPTYKLYGDVECFDKKYMKTGDSFREFHRLIADRKTYDIIDIDPYGFPCRMFPDLFLLIDSGYLFVTMPKPYINILNGITQTFLFSYFKDTNPSLETIIEQFATWGLCHWRKVELLDVINLDSIWRLAFKVDKVLATEYTGVINRPKETK